MTAQAMQALARANEIRVARSKAKVEIAEGRLPVVSALESECWQSATVACLLSTQWNWGPLTASKFLAGLGISPGRRIRDLTSRQRGLVADGLSERTTP